MERFVVALTRTCGSGGTTISKMLADDFGIDMYDRKLLRLASEDSGINEELFAKADELTKSRLLYRVSKKVYNGEIIPPESNDFVSDQNLFNYQAKVLKELAERESYVCVGRACDFVLKDYSHVLKVFIYAPEEYRIQHIMEQRGVSRKQAEDLVKYNDGMLKSRYEYMTGSDMSDCHTRHMMIDSSVLGLEKTAEYILQLIDLRFED